MINKLRKKFTALATVSMLLLMAVLVLIMNIVNYSSVVSEIDNVLDVLSQPNAPFTERTDIPESPGLPAKDFVPRGMSPEVPYESRFFVVAVSKNGEIKESDLSRIVSVDDESAKEYIEEAVESRRDRGFIGQFRYSKTTDDRMTRILFLDCGRKLDAFRTFLLISSGVGLLGCLIVFVAFLFVSGRIVGPIAESYEKQKRFISDAGHEIKTPLTIINANVDLMECDGEREELGEIRHQTQRLTELTNSLVYLSKMEETEHTIKKETLCISEILEEAVNSFRILAASKKLSLEAMLTPDISVEAEPDSVRRLISILLDNAVKYSPEDGRVKVGLSANRKNAVITVCNTTAEKVDNETLLNVFDRFYRADASRNSETGGHGIGLSVAKAIAEAHDGSISADTKTGNDFCITVNLPL